MPNLRLMADVDLPQVNLILSKAFTHARLQTGLRDSRVPLCRIDFLKMYRAANAEGSFVIAEDGKIVAYCFSRLWGSVGWIGPLSVIPAKESKGYGKRVVGAAVEVLKSQCAETIGLEMAAQSTRNLAFYTKLGFRPNKLTADLIRPVGEPARQKSRRKIAAQRFSELSVPDQMMHGEALRKFFNQFQSGLDYTSEIQLTIDFSFGDAVMFFWEKKLVGFVLAHTETYSQGERREFLKVNALQMLPDVGLESLADLISQLDDWARAENLLATYIRVPTRYHAGFQTILSQNFRLVNSELRMTLEDYPQRDDPAMINFNKWE